MRENNTRSFSSVGRQVRLEREKRRKKRAILISAIAVVSIAIILFAFLILAEIFGWFEKAPEVPDDGPSNVGIKLEFEELLKSSDEIHKGDLILINSAFPYVFPDTPPTVSPVTSGRTEFDYVNSEGKKTKVFSYYTQSGEQACARIETETLKLLQKWSDDFYRATGNIDLFIFNEDGYRTKDDQSAYYAESPVNYAAPGETEHHTGKIIDLYVYTAAGVRGNIDDPEFAATFKWIYDNAYKYGFVHRYPSDKTAVTGVSYEPYHFRQVGYAHAYYMTKNGYCLEEYLDLLKDSYTYSTAALEFKGDDGNSYIVYYVPASADGITAIPVPKDGQGCTYTVSGDNKEGFVVTVTTVNEQ